MARPNVKLSAVMWRELFERYATNGRNLQNQIRTMMVDAILEGRLPAGEELPSSRELSESLGVARNTVVLAYQQLVAKGYLLTRDRSGHRVNPDMAPTRSSQGGAVSAAETERAPVIALNRRAPDWVPEPKEPNLRLVPNNEASKESDSGEPSEEPRNTNTPDHPEKKD